MKTETEVVFLSGPMTGIKNYNREAFDDAEYAIRQKYLYRNEPVEIINPAASDYVQGAERTGQEVQVGSKEYATILGSCLDRLKGATVVVMLPGWEKSKGASIEHYAAERMGILTTTLESYLNLIEPPTRTIKIPAEMWDELLKDSDNED